MREILFRGKRTDNGRWVEGYLIADTEFAGKPYYHTYIVNYKSPSGCFGGDIFIEIIPETVGQYTGLTDKNGAKIFEGDICRKFKSGDCVSVAWHGTMAGYVWSKRKENNRYIFDFGDLFRVSDKYEVIGNIHDNPELLDGAGNG